MSLKPKSEIPRAIPPENGVDRAETEFDSGGVRGRPGRRTVQERREAVLALIAGKSSIDQIALRYGVLPETVEEWRKDAVKGIEDAFRRDGKSPRERELVRENKELREVVSDLSIRHALLERELKNRPSPPGRSQR